jgi:hypothetical protein
MIYYELNRSVADHYYNGVRYWVSNGDTKPDSWIGAMQRSRGGGSLKLLQHSERAWEEEGDVVKFIKNRFTGLMTPIDMREFFLVKLRARST